MARNDDYCHDDRFGGDADHLANVDGYLEADSEPLHGGEGHGQSHNVDLDGESLVPGDELSDDLNDDDLARGRDDFQIVSKRADASTRQTDFRVRLGQRNALHKLLA